MIADALGSLGVVDVCVLNAWRPAALDEPWPAWVGDAEWCRTETPEHWPASAVVGRTSPVPFGRVAPEAVPAARTRFFSKRYDLIWCEEGRGYEPVKELVSGATVLDLQNVHSVAVAHKRRAILSRWWDPASWRGALAEPAWVPGLGRAWRRWEGDAVRRCARVVVCSDLDRARLGGVNVATIPNCYPRPSDPAGERFGADPDRLVVGVVGLFDYQPNADGLRWFLSEVWPSVRTLEPGAQLRVIGLDGEDVVGTNAPAGVRALGFVDDLEGTLADLSVLVTPLRVGGGTRLKILEAFAHRIPMVSTTVGAEGLDVSDGRELLLRDDAEAFARGIVDVHRERVLRQRLVDNATRLYEARYTVERGRGAVLALARALLPAATA
jgi:glycosyltransferase involved in cell wall biosynthesis